MEPEVHRADEHLGKLCQLLDRAIEERREEAIRSYRRGVQSALQRMEGTAERLVQANRWDTSLVGQLMNDVEGSVNYLLERAEDMLKWLASEAKKDWETRTRDQAQRTLNLAGEVFEGLRTDRWSYKDCEEYMKELSAAEKVLRKIIAEFKPSELSTQMRRAINLRQRNVNTEVERARRIVSRLMVEHECQLTGPIRDLREEPIASATEVSRPATAEAETMTSTVTLQPRAPERNQENDNVSVVVPARARGAGLAMRILEHYNQSAALPAGNSTPTSESNSRLPEYTALSSVRRLRGVRLEINSRDEEEDMEFRQSRSYPPWDNG
jgi:hypothetical protein